MKALNEVGKEVATWVSVSELGYVIQALGQLTDIGTFSKHSFGSSHDHREL